MYGQTATVKNYASLRTATLWAGWLGVVQSLIWIGLTITGIVAYNCLIYITNFLSFGTLIRTVFFDLYFHGNCQMDPSDYQNYNRSMLLSVDTVLDSEQILIWDCVYLGVAVCWLIASVVILTYINKKCISHTLACLYTWIFFTCAICLMDLALGIIFGIDYGHFASKAIDYNANSMNAGPIDDNAAQLVAATVASMSLMIISFKGFVMWIINFGLLIYLLVRAVQIVRDMDSSDTLFMPRKASDDILATSKAAAPIRAYDEVQVQAYSNVAYEPDRTRRSVEVIEVNEEAIGRAAHMSRDSNFMDRRFRNLDAYQQYPAPNNNNNTRPQRQVQETVVVASSGFPVPDYSPVGSPNGILRPHQY